MDNTYILSGKTFNVESGISQQLLNQLQINYRGVLTVQSNSILNIKTNAEVRVKNGGLLCNYGTITGPGNLIIEGAGRRSGCTPWDGIIKNNAVVILTDSALFEIPDNSILTLDSVSVLVLKPNSTIKFGTNSKLILKNGAG